MAKRLEAMSGLPGTTASDQIEELRSSPDRCAACLVRQRSEQAAIRGLLEAHTADGARDASPTLCLEHLRLLLPAADEETAGAFLQSQSRGLTETMEALHEYVLKRDARRRELLTRDEEDAYRRALELLVGDRNLS